MLLTSPASVPIRRKQITALGVSKGSRPEDKSEVNIFLAYLLLLQGPPPSPTPYTHSTL